jgi:AcrR family transcriptional regulator
MAKRRDKERTKALIRQCALECFTENGADRTTVLEIARRAKVPHSLVHYYYGSQDELFAEVFESVVEHIRQHVTPPLEKKGATPRAALLGYVHAHFKWAQAYPAEFAIWLYFYYAAVLGERYRKLNGQIQAAGNTRIAAVIYAGVHAREFRVAPDASIPALAAEIQVIMTGAWVMGATGHPAHPRELYRRAEASILHLLGVEA